MLRQAMTTRAEIDLASYDRLFPSQDTMPKGSFGNLIALPLQGEAGRQGTTVFLDPGSLEPYEDQWAFLSSVPRLSPEALGAIADAVRPLDVGTESLTWQERRDHHPAPETVRARLGGMLSIERIGLPPWLIARLKHLASLHNPEFYERERLRLSTYNTPRLIRSYLEELDRICLPRGLVEAAGQVIVEAGGTFDLTDARPDVAPLDLSFHGELSPVQASALAILREHDCGVLVAPTGAGQDHHRVRRHRRPQRAHACAD